MFKALFLISIASLIGHSKHNIPLKNPSFEEDNEKVLTLNGWDICGKYSTPDLLPGLWGVSKKAAHGNKFIGLTVREDNTWEYIGQELSEPLMPAKCYKFSLSLAKDATYSGYIQPVKIRIWGGVDKCSKTELLTETKAINHTDWKQYSFLLSPKKEVKYLIIEAYFIGKKPYKGNVLIDDCSPIQTCTSA